MPGGPYSVATATYPQALGGFDPSKPTYTPTGERANLSLTRAKQAPATSTDHPLAGHSPPRATYSPHSTKGRRLMRQMFEEVHEDEPAVVGTTRRKKGSAAAKRQRTAIALSKARRAGVRIPKKG